MQFSYGEQMPLRLLDEATFWKHQESEHTVVIREITPNLERKFVEELKQWESALVKTHSLAVQLTETVVRSGNTVPPVIAEEVLRLMSFSLEQSGRFVKFLFGILDMSPSVKRNSIAQTVVKHIIRESEYFIGIAQAICGNG
ncbi:MAG: hypothetical protein AWM53_00155 [Candidatus Dichloromethanomonas elyunquensis]|nr:MAG: hypothetical protein AWM53_00155 [Candidatus Dichloromethanomonas elyunquensis]